jgi:S-adenosylmethionine-diacylglycerol 3-amino-3-carboxypropyl transferase
MSKQRIQYSQCWEDPELVLEALKLRRGDRVLSITSGGDNTLALLHQEPREVVSIDLNEMQNHLLELKHVALTTLSKEECLEFLGERPSDTRNETYQKLVPSLSPRARAWWDDHEKDIQEGVIHCGRFERFTRFFAKQVLPRIHKKKTIENFLSASSIDAQVTFYTKHFNTPLWQLVFSLATTRFMLAKARQRIMFSQTQTSALSKTYASRLLDFLSRVPVAHNYFFTYSLTGEHREDVPPYLAGRHNNNTKLTIVTDELLSYLRTQEDASISAFNFSDIFEALDDASHEETWREIVRVAMPGSRFIFWENLLNRDIPEALKPWVEIDRNLSRSLTQKDRVFFYDSCTAGTIHP